MANKNKYFCHPKAIVETECIGGGTRIWAFAHVLKGARIGTDCNICDHTFIESDVVVGNNVTVKSGVYIWDKIRVEDDVFIGPGAAFINDRYPRSKIYGRHAGLRIGKGASIGANATILCGVNVGSYAMVGAGAVVTRDIPAHTLVYGNPSRARGHVCKCGVTLKFVRGNACCECGEKYNISRGQIVL